MEKEFKFNVYSRRWGHYDHYTIKLNENGWDFSGVSVPLSGECDKAGNPFLFKTLDHDTINYPKDLGEYLEWLWYQATEQGLSQEEIQNALNMLAEWVSLCEKSSPKGIWESYK